MEVEDLLLEISNVINHLQVQIDSFDLLDGSEDSDLKKNLEVVLLEFQKKYIDIELKSMDSSLRFLNDGNFVGFVPK